LEEFKKIVKDYSNDKSVLVFVSQRSGTIRIESASN